MSTHSSCNRKRCCVKKATSKIVSWCNNSFTSYFMDSSYAYSMLVSYSIILQCASAKIQFLKRTMTWRSVCATGSVRFCVKPPLPSTSLFTVGDIHMKPLLPRITDAPHVRLWKWVLLRFTSDGNTLTNIPCDNWVRRRRIVKRPQIKNRLVAIDLLFHISNFVYTARHYRHHICSELQLRSGHLLANTFSSCAHPQRIVFSAHLKREISVRNRPSVSFQNTLKPPGKLTDDNNNTESKRELVSAFQRFCWTSIILATTTSPTSPTYRLFSGLIEINLFTCSKQPASDAFMLSSSPYVPWPLNGNNLESDEKFRSD